MSGVQDYHILVASHGLHGSSSIVRLRARLMLARIIWTKMGDGCTVRLASAHILRLLKPLWPTPGRSVLNAVPQRAPLFPGSSAERARKGAQERFRYSEYRLGKFTVAECAASPRRAMFAACLRWLLMEGTMEARL